MSSPLVKAAFATVPRERFVGVGPWRVKSPWSSAEYWTTEDADPAVALDKGGRPKAEAPKVHIGFRLAADVVASVKASGPGYNVRVEQALRAAGFGAAKKRRGAE